MNGILGLVFGICVGEVILLMCVMRENKRLRRALLHAGLLVVQMREEREREEKETGSCAS